jgi:hypothetical protein
MKIKVFAVVLISLICTAVILNTVMLTKTINGFSERISALDISQSDISGAEADARRAYEEFKKRETFMSLTVNHNDLTAIEELFSEMIGYLSIQDADGASVAKSRLIDALSHLRRLSGVNIDSVV